MNHNRVTRILALLLVIAMIVLCVLLATPVRAAECRLQRPEPEELEPDEAEVLAVARTLYGECWGCSELQQRAVCWCIFNRVDDSRFPDSIIGVVSAPYQFAGYNANSPVTDELYGLARECIIDWHNKENRVLEPGFCFFFGNGRINIFSTEYGGKGKRWEEE